MNPRTKPLVRSQEMIDYMDKVHAAVLKAVEDAELPVALSWAKHPHRPEATGAALIVSAEGISLGTWGWNGLAGVAIEWNGRKLTATPYLGDARRAPLSVPETVARIVVEAIKDAQVKDEEKAFLKQKEREFCVKAEELFPGWRHSCNASKDFLGKIMARGSSRMSFPGDTEACVEWGLKDEQIVVAKLEGDYFATVNQMYESRIQEARRLRLHEASARVFMGAPT